MKNIIIKGGVNNKPFNEKVSKNMRVDKGYFPY